jgi:hypothetical protein
MTQSARTASRAYDHQRAAELYTQALAQESHIISPDPLPRDSQHNYPDLRGQAFAGCDAATSRCFR